RYEEGFLSAMRRIVSPGRHVNVMQHLAGYLKRDLAAGDRDDIQRVIEDYRRGMLPLITPLTLLQHHFRRLRHDWVDAQAYLDPYPRELGLRSSI
ncbi:MAG: YbgA family protein, partial [Candidatus Krumholzibacteriota bacterium]|nr:YbgA family protein [Candidatus Krumholzibacteriota bacterium]